MMIQKRYGVLDVLKKDLPYGWIVIHTEDLDIFTLCQRVRNELLLGTDKVIYCSLGVRHTVYLIS